jgi:ketosteroid isomerase-like protein
MRSGAKAYPVGLLLLAAIGCQMAETPATMQARIDQESAAARQAIEAATANFERWFAAGQVDSLVSNYTDNATFMPPNQKAATGRDNIQAVFVGWLGMGKWSLDLRPGSVVANGPLAIESGTFVISFTPGPNAMPGMAPADTGKYLVHWHQVGGQWKIVDDIFNSDLPLPQPAAPARRR